MTASAPGRKAGANVTSKAMATSRKASICNTESNVPAASLQASSQALGSGAVSSRRITPISRSYTMANEDCMPLNSAIMPSRPGVT